MLFFVIGRVRYDIVALASLLAAVLSGVVPQDRAFSGFSDDIVIIVACALVVSAGVARSGLPEIVLLRVLPIITSPGAAVAVLAAAVAILSAFVKNVGALALMMPIAMRMSARGQYPSSKLLMPMSFAALMGGLVTLIGTSPNIVVSRLREQSIGAPFQFFDFAPVGLGIAAVGIAYLCIAFRLLPGDRRAAPTLDESLDMQDYTTEAYLAEDAALVGRPLSDLIESLGTEVSLSAILRGGSERMAPLPDVLIRKGDIFMLQGKPETLQHAITRGGLLVEGTTRPPEIADAGGEARSIEAIVGPASILIGQSAARLDMRSNYNINLLAVSRDDQRFTERLRNIVLHAGDILVLQGGTADLSDRLQELGCYPLAERNIQLGDVRRTLLPIVILAGAMIAAVSGVVPVALAFFAGALGMVIFSALSLREAYAAIDWPILLMLGALIPLSEAIRENGGAQMVAHGLASAATGFPPAGLVALVMVTAMAVTPFLNNAATVLIMGPIAMSFAGDLGYKPDAFLMAVAIGAGCDFLTPTGHQCNTMVFQAGGYRFGDFAKLGAPLTALVVAVGVPLVLWVWPLYVW